MVLTNPIPGPPAAVFRSVLATDPDHAPAPGVQRMAYFSTSNFPGLPSLVNEVVWVPVYALVNANMEVDGILVSQGWATDGVTTVTANYTAQSTDAIILANATGGAVTVTLPDATQTGFSPGQRYTVIKTDSSANAVTVAASAGQLIGGASTVTLTAANGYVSVAFDGVTGTNWWIWATSGGGFSPTGPAGGALTGTYPNPGLAVPVSVSASSGTFGGLVAVTQQSSTPSQPGVGLTGQVAGNAQFGVQLAGDTVPRLAINGDGPVSWSSGSAAADVRLRRSGTSVLNVTNAGSANSPQFSVTSGVSGTAPLFQAVNNASADLSYGVQVAGDTVERFTVDSNGRHQWGPGGSTAVDTTLQRSAAGTLATGALTLTTALAITSGGTGQATQQAAINALTGTQSAGKYLRSDGTNATLAAIQVADLPNDSPNYVPADFSYVGWSFPIFMASGSAQLPTAGALFLVKIPVRSTQSVTGIRVYMATAGATLTANQNFAGLFDSNGNKIGVTADQSTNWTGATGIVDANLVSGPFNASSPFVWAAFLWNGTTAPAFQRGTSLSSSASNGKNSVSTANFGTILTGQTSLPASLTPSGIALASSAFWVALF